MILLWLFTTLILVYAAWRCAVAALRLLFWLAVGVVKFICWV